METPSGSGHTSPAPSAIGIVINGFAFATPEDVQRSLAAASADNIEPHTIAKRLKDIDEISSLFKCTAAVFKDWCDIVKAHIAITNSSAAFTDASTSTNAIVYLWRQYWVKKLKTLAPDRLTYNPNASPLDLLTKFCIAMAAKVDVSRNQVVQAFWSLKPQQNMTALQAEVDKQITRFSTLFSLDDATPLAQNYQILVCCCMQAHRPEIALLCNNKTLTETLVILRTHAVNSRKSTSGNIRSKTDKDHTRGATCNHCSIPGHTDAQCWKKHGKPENKSKSEEKVPKAKAVRMSSGQGYQLDTAADEHIAFNETEFSSYRRHTRTAHLANGSPVQVIGDGSIQVPSLIPYQPLLLRNATHIKGSGPTLLSLAQLSDQGFYLHAQKDTPIEIRRGYDDTTVLEFKRQKNQYMWLPPAPSSQPAPTTATQTPDPCPNWHATLGHVNPRALKHTLQQHGLHDGVKSLPTTKTCVACAQAKFTSTPGKGKLIHEAKGFLDVLHVDLVGGKDALPSSTSASDVPAATLALTIIDEFTRYKWAIPLHSKSDAPIHLKGLLLQLQRRFSRQPFRIHSDRGSEFIGGSLSDWLVERGIKWTGSAAHAHQQNGLIERTNRTIFEALRASHIHANIPSKVWSTTILAVVDTLNSTATTSGEVSPHEKAFGERPALVTEPLGCRVIFRKDDKASLPKLASRTTEGVFLGKQRGVAQIYDVLSKRVITRRDYTAFPQEFPLRSCIAAISLQDNPPHTHEISVPRALSSAERENWYRAMNKEINLMHHNDVWTLVPRSSLPPGTRIMSGTWVFRSKAKNDKKARWCARGFAEPDVNTVYADVLQAVSMRLFFAYAAHHGYKVRHVDVTSAFLNAPLDKPIYMVQPLYLPQVSGMVCKLNRAIYGLRTAPRRWQETLAKSLASKGYQRLTADRNLYRKNGVLLSVYVDDFKITGPDHEIESTVQDLRSLYTIKDLGSISHYLGMEVTHTTEGGYKLAQTAKIKALLRVLDLESARPVKVPVPDDNKIDLDPKDAASNAQATLYRSAVGQLLHISLLTRPDIAYAVMRLTQRFALPTLNALRALKDVARYLLGTQDLGIYFKPSSGKAIGSSDSSWSTAAQAKATTGNIFLFNGTPVAWRAKRQSLTAQSTCEAEYVAASTAATQARWLLPLIKEIWQAPHGPIALQMDNQAAISVANSDNVTARNRHFLIRQSVLREAVTDDIIKIQYTPTTEMIADGLTKGLQKIKHASFVNMLQLA